jgi:hypothetical protein
MILVAYVALSIETPAQSIVLASADPGALMYIDPTARGLHDVDATDELATRVKTGLPDACPSTASA